MAYPFYDPLKIIDILMTHRFDLKKWLVRIFWLILLIGLLAWAIVAAPLAEIFESLKQLHLWQIGILLVINSAVIVFITLRWWLIIRAETNKVPLIPLIGYRLAAFGVSYFTPGPQVGGEPLQVLYLQKYNRLTYARATSTVIVDKLLEFLVNILFLALGLFVVLQQGLIPFNESQLIGSLAPLLVVLLIPPLHITLLFLGKHPLSAIASFIQDRIGRRKFLRLMIVSEHLAGTFTRRHFGTMLGAIFASALAMTCMWVEYWLMARFLSIYLSGIQALAGLTIVQLAFMLPLPAGLGALEASQVFIMGAMGFPPAAGLTMSLLMRGRDILFGGLGLIRAGKI
jgi:glycosyltransferase 2 family protein